MFVGFFCMFSPILLNVSLIKKLLTLTRDLPFIIYIYFYEITRIGTPVHLSRTSLHVLTSSIQLIYSSAESRKIAGRFFEEILWKVTRYEKSF